MLAGCFSVPTATHVPNPSDARASVNCDFRYPDGGRVPCDPTVIPVTTYGSKPNEWTCIHHYPDILTLYVNRVTQSTGIRLGVNESGKNIAVITFETRATLESTTLQRQVAFETSADEDLVAFSKTTEGKLRVLAEVYSIGVVDSQNGIAVPFDPIWSYTMRNSSDSGDGAQVPLNWLLLHVRPSGSAFYVDPMAELAVRTGRGSVSLYGPRSINVTFDSNDYTVRISTLESFFDSSWSDAFETHPSCLNERIPSVGDRPSPCRRECR